MAVRPRCRGAAAVQERVAAGDVEGKVDLLVQALTPAARMRREHEAETGDGYRVGVHVHPVDGDDGVLISSHWSVSPAVSFQARRRRETRRAGSGRCRRPGR